MQDAAIKVAPSPLSSKQFDFRNLEKLKSYYDAFSGPNSMRNIMGAYVFYLVRIEHEFGRKFFR